MVKTLPRKAHSVKKKMSDHNKKSVGLYAIVYFVIAIMLFFSFFSFDEQDISLDSATSSSVVNNLLGISGAYISSFFISLFGWTSWVFPIVLFFMGVSLLRHEKHLSWSQFFVIFFGIALLSVYVSAFSLQIANEKSGGVLGVFLYSFLSSGIGLVGIFILSCAYIAIFCEAILDISVPSFIKSLYFFLAQIKNGNTKEKFLKKKAFEQEDITLHDIMMETVDTRDFSTKNSNIKEQIKRFYTNFSLWFGKRKEDKDGREAIFDDLSKLPSYGSAHSFSNGVEEEKGIYMEICDDPSELILPTRDVTLSLKNQDNPSTTECAYVEENISSLPTTNLLDPVKDTALTEDQKRKIEETGALIIECLSEFKVKADLVGYTVGPVVTQYQIRPLPGVRVNKIKTFDNDIALKLKASSVRIQAPIPETDLIGIEVPNKKRTLIYFQNLLVSPLFKSAKSPLTMALGKDTAGNPFFADLAKMPHLLIAGATGAGKSVCLNSIILSFLYKASPKELQLLLIDPKRVELKIYQDLPHLVHPVVTDVELACSALSWAVYEMERRYTAMEQMGSREIGEYNAKVRTLTEGHSEQMKGLQEFPLLVIIVDELADLILTTPKEVETNLTRLSQLARAAGIHIILATQRPSVDVVTALIKANFPSRIAFRVTSRHDSTTILGNVGAENLLGKGDMLFKTTHTQRLHGAYVSTAETEAVVNYWKSKETVKYSLDFTDFLQSKSVSTKHSLFVDEDDPIYHEAVSFVYEQGKASISSIQRRFRIGFNKAARYVEQMERDGIITAADGSPKARTVKRPG
ncbi:MAG: DNA translocase FtsK [Desulfovibrionaceae bacterium]